MAQQLVLLLFLFSVGCVSLHEPNSVRAAMDLVPYIVIEDEMTSRIVIGIDVGVKESQLRDTLAQAASDHQDDRARDYLFSDRLIVEAYLMTGDLKSSIAAGKLIRYVSPKSSDGNQTSEKIHSVSQKDIVYLNLLAARGSIR
ncbi:MAG: hypothetical protein ABI857_03000 [Acidobacteriota bacterium]